MPLVVGTPTGSASASTAGSSIEVVDVLREAGCNVLGIASIFTYGLQKGLDRLEKANVINHSLSNFETLVNTHGALGYVHYLLKQDPDTGAVQYDKVIEFSTESGKSGTYYKYNKFFGYYGTSFKSYAKFTKQHDLDISINDSRPTGVDYSIEIQYDQIFPDLEFKNYYYFENRVPQAVKL